MNESKHASPLLMRPLKFKDGSTLEDLVAKVLSEILSDKYDCKVTIRFRPKSDEEGASQATNADAPA